MELSHTTVKKEIEQLEQKSKSKAIALKDSSTKLEGDHIKLIKYIENDNLNTN